MAHAKTVVLVHGLWMHGVAMRFMQRRLKECGYDVRRYSYSTVRCDLTENAKRLASHVEALGVRPVHLIGHSMGGLVALCAAQRLAPSLRGRIIVCGTPYTDTFSGRRLEGYRGGGWLLGKCMGEWLHQPRAPLTADAGLDIGVIAGDGGFGMARLIARSLPKPHDGVVAVTETQVPHMRDRIVLDVSHTQMLISQKVAHQACFYLANGRFDHSTMPAPGSS
ncbi:MAG: alpha/beta hydrolase [Pseudomonadota bacterium]